MARYEYRPRPSIDPRADCVRAGWRTPEDLAPEGEVVSREAISELSAMVLNHVADGQLYGVYSRDYSRVIFDLDKTPEGETLFLAQTVGQNGNTVLYIAEKNIG
jgi:hypothetical protein